MSALGAYAAAERRASAPAGVWLAAAALLALALATQLRLGMMADVAWLIDCDARWLAGAVPYRDFVEINPPASLLLYLPAVAAARALGAPAETMVSAFGFLAAGAALAVSAAILRRVGASVALAALVALVVLPGETFCERDHLAAVFGAPFLALAVARAERGTAPFGLALAAGLGAGAMAAIKPPYALVGVGLALYLGKRIGWRAVVRAPEYYAAAAVGLAYVACVGPMFPYYVRDVLPLGVAVYVPAREGMASLLASPGALVILLISATAALAARERGYGPGFVVAALATLGAAVAYLVQGKGWVYQAVPAAMFATLAGGFALDGERRLAALAGGGVVAGVLAPMLHNIGLAWVAGLAVGAAIEAARTRRLELRDFGAVAWAAAVGAACGVCTIERPPTPALEQALAGLGGPLRIATLSEDMGLGFPLVRRLGATWVLSENSLFLSSAVDHIRNSNPALGDQFQPYAERERAQMLAEIAKRRPDALLVGPLGTRIHAAVVADPRAQAVLADYKRIAVEETPGYAAELWMRKDFAPLKP